MPLYQYEHVDDPRDCEDPFEVLVGQGTALTDCPRCGRPVRKIPAAFTPRGNILSTSNIKDKGFQRWRNRDPGVYEKD